MAHGITEITTDVFEAEVLDSDLPVLVDFWAPWCGPCRMVAPILDDLAIEYSGKVSFAKINVDEEQELAVKYGVMSIPTLIYFKDGKEINRIVGLKTKEQIAEMF